MLPFWPLHIGLELVAVTLIEEVIAVITTCFELVQPLASVANTVYVPAIITLYGEVAATSFTLYVITPIPPVALNTKLPF